MSPKKKPLFSAVEGQSEPFHAPVDNQCIPVLEVYRSYFLGFEMKKQLGRLLLFTFYSPNAPYKIKHYLPDVKLIAILRNPVDRLVRGLRQRNITKPELDRQVRGWLIEYYREDILRTQDILRRNLTHWLKAPMDQTIR